MSLRIGDLYKVKRGNVYHKRIEGNLEQDTKGGIMQMAAGKCKAVYHTDEWHGYGCSITEGACMFLYPDSKACAREYGEGPDADHEEDSAVDLTK